MEAWEELAPELPPGWGILTDGIGWHDIYQHQGAFVTKSPPGRSRRMAWEAFGITRKRYAELIAVERVREVAEAEYGCDRFWVDYTYFSDGRHCLLVSSEYAKNGPLAFRGQGPTICDAAWECIQALGGGE